MSAPNPVELVDAAAALVLASDYPGVVESDPVFPIGAESEKDVLQGYAQQILTNGVIDGVVLEYGGEEDEDRTGKRVEGDLVFDGTANFGTILIHLMTEVNPYRTPVPSRIYFGRKFESIKEQFRLQSNYGLGFANDGYQVKQHIPRASAGITRITLSAEREVHYSLLELRFWIRRC